MIRTRSAPGEESTGGQPGSAPARVAGLVALAAALTLVGVLLRESFTRRFPGGNDLYPRWSAGCAWLERGVDPYSPQATLEVQRGIYGRPATVDEDQVAFAYPIYTVLLTWPLCLSDEFATAHAAAMTALIVATVLTARAARAAVGLRLDGRLWVWVVLWVVLSYPSLRGILLGQPAVLVSLLQVGCLLAVRRGRDTLAGFALALSTIKPQMGLLFVPWLLSWWLWRRRWKAAAAFAVSMVALVAVPLIWLPDWPAAWLRQLTAYTSYTEFGSLTWILTTYLLATPSPVEAALTALFGLWTVVEAVRSRRKGFEAALWTGAFVLVVSHFVSPRTATTHFGSLLVPFLLAVRLAVERGGRRARAWLAAGMPTLAGLSWLLFLVTVEGRQESAWNYLPIPIILLALLVAVRADWLRTVDGRA